MTAELEWIKLYRAALRETDPDKQPARVEEAKRAMKQALRMAVEYEDSDQRHAISDALSHLENIGRHPLFPAKEAHSFIIIDVLRAIDDGNHFLLGTNGLTGTGVLDNFFEVALRRIPILDPNFVVGDNKLLYGKSCP